MLPFPRGRGTLYTRVWSLKNPLFWTRKVTGTPCKSGFDDSKFLPGKKKCSFVSSAELGMDLKNSQTWDPGSCPMDGPAC